MSEVVWGGERQEKMTVEERCGGEGERGVGGSVVVAGHNGVSLSEDSVGVRRAGRESVEERVSVGSVLGLGFNRRWERIFPFVV